MDFNLEARFWKWHYLIGWTVGLGISTDLACIDLFHSYNTRHNFYFAK